MSTRQLIPMQAAPKFSPLTRVSHPMLQRKCACGGSPGLTGECENCKKKNGVLQRKSNGRSAPDAIPPIVHEVLRSPGQPLDHGTRTFMESRFGWDFSQVRLHTNLHAAKSARAVSALAYTVGRDIVFGAGEYLPHTKQGMSLLAHELAHVVQQHRAVEGTTVDQSDSIWERSATAAAGQIVEGRAIGDIPSSGQCSLARQSAPTQSPDDHDISEADWLEAGLIALGKELQFVASPEAGALRDIYNAGAAEIEAERLKLAQKLSGSELAQRLSGMRHDLALKVRKAGSALMRKGAEVFDLIRGNAKRPTYEALKAAGKTDAEIILSAAKTNKFINWLPKGLKWTGRGLWFVQAGISIYIILKAPPEKRGEVAQKEIEGIVGGIGGAAAFETICLAVGIATEGLGLIVCGLVGGAAGYEGARHGNLLQVLDIAPHQEPASAGRLYRIEGVWDEIDLFILSIPRRTVAKADNLLVVATGKRSGEQVSGRGHYRSLEVTPANQPSEKLFGNVESRYVPEYLLQPADKNDLLQAQE